MSKVKINSDSEERLLTLHGVGQVVCDNILEMRGSTPITKENLGTVTNLRVTPELLEQIDFFCIRDEVDDIIEPEGNLV